MVIMRMDSGMSLSRSKQLRSTKQARNQMACLQRTRYRPTIMRLAIDSSRANRQKILLGSQLLQDGTSGSLGQKGLKRFARTCLSVGRMKSFKNLKRSRHARRQSAKTSCACCRGSCECGSRRFMHFPCLQLQA